MIKAIALYAFCAGIVVGTRLPEGFFKPWTEDGNFYGGEHVRHDSEGADPFYTLCDEGKVVYVYDQNHIVVHWSKCDRIPDPEAKKGFLEIHELRNLVKI